VADYVVAPMWGDRRDAKLVGGSWHAAFCVTERSSHITESLVRTKNIGLAAAAFTVAFGTAACGTSGSTAATSHPKLAATPTTARSAGPFDGNQLKAALLDASNWGSGWTDVVDGPRVNTSGLGTIAQIPSEPCTVAFGMGAARNGAVASVEDVVDSHTDDIAFQNIYQYGPGDAATMMTDTAKKMDSCGTFKYTADDNSTTTDVTREQPVPGLGDQAIKIVVTSISLQNPENFETQLWVRYGDVVIDVKYDSSVSAHADGYDLAGKAKAIEAKLEKTATG